MSIEPDDVVSYALGSVRLKVFYFHQSANYHSERLLTQSNGDVYEQSGQLSLRRRFARKLSTCTSALLSETLEYAHRIMGGFRFRAARWAFLFDNTSIVDVPVSSRQCSS
jgi:hypothetical protein